MLGLVAEKVNEPAICVSALTRGLRFRPDDTYARTVLQRCSSMLHSSFAAYSSSSVSTHKLDESTWIENSIARANLLWEEDSRDSPNPSPPSKALPSLAAPSVDEARPPSASVSQSAPHLPLELPLTEAQESKSSEAANQSRFIRDSSHVQCFSLGFTAFRVATRERWCSCCCCFPCAKAHTAASNSSLCDLCSAAVRSCRLLWHEHEEVCSKTNQKAISDPSSCVTIMTLLHLLSSFNIHFSFPCVNPLTKLLSMRTDSHEEALT